MGCRTVRGRGPTVAVRAKLRDQAPDRLIRGYRLAAARSSATCAPLSARRDSGVWRTRLPEPRKLHHTALRSLPRCSPIKASQSGLASSCVHAASKTATGVPVSLSRISWTPALPWRHESGDAEQILALDPGHAQSAAQGLDNLFRRVGRPALTKAGDVVDRDPGQLREFLPIQTGRSPVPADG
jgi:hypothetical protein